MKKQIEYLLIFLFGGNIYCMIEILYVRKTHISMFIAGGLVLMLFYIIQTKHLIRHPFVKYVTGGAIITVIELITGFIVNLWLKENVWDYSYHKVNFLGQICLVNCIGWIGMSVIGFGLCRFLGRNLKVT